MNYLSNKCKLKLSAHLFLIPSETVYCHTFQINISLVLLQNKATGLEKLKKTIKISFWCLWDFLLKLNFIETILQENSQSFNCSTTLFCGAINPNVRLPRTEIRFCRKILINQHSSPHFHTALTKIHTHFPLNWSFTYSHPTLKQKSCRVLTRPLQNDYF